MLVLDNVLFLYHYNLPFSYLMEYQHSFLLLIYFFFLMKEIYLCTLKKIILFKCSKFKISPLVIPKNHHGNIAELTMNSPEQLVDLMQLGTQIALEKSTGSFRLSFNTGEEAGQTVFHAHGHITSRTPIGSSSANEGDFAK